MKTIFCLVSRQAMANVLPVLMYKPKNVVLFTTPEEKPCADNLERLFKSKGIKVKRNDGLDAYDYTRFKDAVKRELESTEDETWLNVTGGTKLMALAAYEAFAEKNKEIIYCNTERNQIIHLFPESNTEELKLSISVEDYLASYGYEIISTRTENIKREYLELFDLLESKNLIPKFSSFLDNYRSATGGADPIKTYKDKKNGIFSIQKTSRELILLIYERKFRFDDERFLKGDWLEYFVRYLLNKKGIKAEVGVKIISEKKVENEIDLIFIIEHKLHLISCKSGKSKPNQDIYEIETLRQIAGGTFGKGFLVTAREIKKEAMKRARELGIKVLNISKLGVDNNFSFD